MRTLPKAITHIKSIDPETALTAHALKILVLSEKLPHIRIGAKRLVDVDLLEKYLSGEYIPPAPTPIMHGVIRPIPERKKANG